MRIAYSGPDEATGVVVSDTLPDGVTYITDNSGGQYSGGLWTVGTVPAGDSRSIEITVTVD